MVINNLDSRLSIPDLVLHLEKTRKNDTPTLIVFEVDKVREQIIGAGLFVYIQSSIDHVAISVRSFGGRKLWLYRVKKWSLSQLEAHLKNLVGFDLAESAIKSAPFAEEVDEVEVRGLASLKTVFEQMGIENGDIAELVNL